MYSIRRYPEGAIITGAYVDLGARVASPARTPREWLSSGLEVAVCGPMFAWDPSSRIVRPLTGVRDRAAGVNLPSTEPDVGGSVVVSSSGARWVDGGAFPDDATVAVQGFPAVLVAGRIAVSGTRDTEATARCAIGLHADGGVAFAVARSLSMIAFARWCASVGLTHATYLDGGSAAAAVDTAGSLAFGGSRAVPSVVGFRSSTSSSTADPSSSSSAWDPTPVLLALLAARAYRTAKR